jgi:hypothetical protein
MRWEFWNGDRYLSWNPLPIYRSVSVVRGVACIDSLALVPFDHIRVPEDYAGALPLGFEWAGCDNCKFSFFPCVLSSVKKVTDERERSCEAWKPRGVA